MSNQDAGKPQPLSPETASRLEQIVAEASVLFRDKGFSATSMNDVARRVGVSKPTLYHHYQNKEDLFVAVVMREPQAAAERMQAVACDDTLDAPEKLRLLLDVAYDNLLNSVAGQMMHTIAETSIRFPEVARTFRDGFIAAQQSALRKIVADGVARGAFKTAPSDFVIEFTFGPPIMMALTKSMFGRLDDTPKTDVEQAKRDHFDALMGVLGSGG